MVRGFFYMRISFLLLLILLTSTPQALNALNDNSSLDGVGRGLSMKYASNRTASYKNPGRQISTSPVSPTILGSERQSARYAKVLKQSYRSISASQAKWEGVVEGNGKVHLTLVISRNGTVESRRYIGSIDLKRHSTWFVFQSAKPPGVQWSWKITARAT